VHFSIIFGKPLKFHDFSQFEEKNFVQDFIREQKKF